MLKEFREFAARGNVIDMAVGIIIGAAFGVVVKSFVSDIIMPPIGLLLGKVSFSNLMLVLKEGVTPGPYATPETAQAAKAVTINYGAFIDNIISFIIVAFAVFILVKQINRFRKQAEPNTKECPHCLSTIPLNATRCAHCTSDLAGAMK